MKSPSSILVFLPLCAHAAQNLDAEALQDAFRHGCFVVAQVGLGVVSLVACGIWLFRQARGLCTSCRAQPLFQSNGIVRNADDGILSKTSIDMSDAATGDSNRQDSDIFDANVPGRLYGRARGSGNGNSVAVIPEGAMNLKTIQAAGVANLIAYTTGASSSAKQCQQQADFVYLSCHGSHANGDIADLHLNCYSCDSVAAKWGDVDVVVIAGCSVLDIGDFRSESFSTSTMMKRWWSAGGSSSPGERWESKGAKVYLGYAWSAPTDADGGAATAATFVAEIASGKDWVEAWRIANDTDAGRNACAIDCRGDHHVFWYWREAGGVATWTSVTKGGTSWE